MRVCPRRTGAREDVVKSLGEVILHARDSFEKKFISVLTSPDRATIRIKKLIELRLIFWSKFAPLPVGLEDYFWKFRLPSEDVGVEVYAWRDKSVITLLIIHLYILPSSF